MFKKKLYLNMKWAVRTLTGIFSPIFTAAGTARAGLHLRIGLLPAPEQRHCEGFLFRIARRWHGIGWHGESFCRLEVDEQ
jgi:hypothetical protein